MTRRSIVRPVLVVVAAFAGALVPLLLLDGDRRALGFRAYGLVVAVLALRAILGFSAYAGAPPVDSPFLRPRRLSLRRRRSKDTDAARRTSIDHLVTGATSQASGFHFRLRPVLRDVADERLRSRHGIGIDDPDAAVLLGPVAHDHLRADRPPPHDRRGPGVDAETLAAILTTVERL